MGNALEDISELSGEKRRLLEQWLEEQGMGTEHLPITPREPDEAPPLSFAQQRVWSLSNFDPEDPSENIHLVFELGGRLDPESLERSFQDLSDRHSVFRSVCSERNGRIFLDVRDRGEFQLNRVDLEHLEGEPQTLRCRELVEREVRRPFSLSKDPPLRASLILLGDDRHVLVIVTHQVAVDGWSMKIFLRELSAFYAARASSSSALLPVLPIDYGDFTAWQRQTMTSEYLRPQCDHWEKRLKNAPAALPLSANGERYRSASTEAATVPFAFSAEQSDRINAFSRREGFTLFTTLLTGFQIALHRFTGVNDVVSATGISNRSRVETEGLIGNFANNLMIRANVAPSASSREVLVNVRDSISEAFSHQDIPLEHLIERATGRGEAMSIPQLQAMFMLRDGTAEEHLELKGLEVRKLGFPLGRSRINLYVDLSSGRDVIAGDVTFKTDLLDETAVRRFLSYFERSLDRLIDDSNGRINGDSDSSLETDGSGGSNRPVTAVGVVATSQDKAERLLPRDDIEIRLAAIWRRLLGHGDFGVRDKFFDLGGHSLLAVGLFNRIEKTFGKKLPLASLFRSQTIEEIAELIRANDPNLPWSPLVPIQPAGSRAPFFCVHGAGGNVLFYRDLARRMGNERPFYGLQSRALQAEGDLPCSVEGLAADYVGEIQRIQDHGPYFLGGYCMGGTVAFEMARQLTQAGEEVALVALLDTYNFSSVDENPTLIGRLHYWMQNIRFHYANLRMIHGTRRVVFLREKLRIAGQRFRMITGGVASTLTGGVFGDGEAGRSIARLWRRNDEVAHSYRPKPYAGRVVVFRPTEMYHCFHDETLGWGRLVTGRLDVAKLSVYPAGMLMEPFVSELAERLGRTLDQSAEQTKSSA